MRAYQETDRHRLVERDPETLAALKLRMRENWGSSKYTDDISGS